MDRSDKGKSGRQRSRQLAHFILSKGASSAVAGDIKSDARFRAAHRSAPKRGMRETLGRDIAAFAAALQAQGRVLLALLKREEQLRRYAPMEAILNLLEPVFLVLTLSFLWSFFGGRQVPPYGDSSVLFYATGFFPAYLFIHISRRMNGSVSASWRRFPIESRLDHIFVHIMLRIFDYTVLGILSFGGIYFLFSTQALPQDIVSVVLACLATTCLGFCFGVMNLVLTKLFWPWEYAYPLFCRVLMMCSGAFFIPDFLSYNVRYILSFNPELHVIILFRRGFYPDFPSLTLDTTYLACAAIIAAFIGFVLERITRRSSGR